MKLNFRFLLSGILLASTIAGFAEKRPNVLFIAVDDLRPELGCYGAKHIISPNIDKLAASGVRFDHAYCQQAICGPSRASVMLGMRPDSTQIHGNHKHFRDHYPDLATLPQHFKNHDYHAQSMGKIYHGVFPKGSSRTEPDTFGDAPSWSVPTYRPGPRYYYTEEGIAAAKQVYQQIYKPKNPGPDDWMKKLVFGPMTEAPDVPDHVLYDGKVARRAVETIRKLAAKPNQPWFLAVGFIKPHTPFIAPKKYWDLYDPEKIQLADWQQFPDGAPGVAGHGSHEIRRYTDQPKNGEFTEANQRKLKHAYYACVSYIDAQIGRVLNELKSQGLDDNTIVVLWSDHGYHLGEQGLWGKTTNYELDTRVALIVRAPGAKANGQPSRALVELVDLYPTLADFAGLPLPDHLEGTSLRPLLDKPDRPWTQAAFSQYTKGKLRGYAMRTEQHRFVEWLNPTTGDIAHTELYDYANDPLEKRNLAKDQPELAAQLSAKLNRGQGWRAAKPKPRQLTLGVPFSDHMVLQRNKPIRIWGAAAPNSPVSVKFSTDTRKTQSGADGKWAITIDPRAANSTPQSIEIKSGSESIQLKDILIGDVWLCAGQSNMRWMVQQSDKAKEEIAKANHPNLRLIHFQDRLYPTGKKYSLAHLRGTTEENYYRTDGWQRCTPETVAEFSAVAYFFGETLHRKSNVPIGLVHNAVGGVPMETYLPPSAFAKDPELAPLTNDYLNNPLYPEWCRGRAALNLSAWIDAGSIPPTPGHPFAPSFLWNAGMKDWTRFPLQGFVWYQGESNATVGPAHQLSLDPAVNERKFRALISSWREAWAEPEMPFLFVQLPGMNRDWELFREMQDKVALEDWNTRMAVTIDVGHPTNVHPTNKRPVGERLAALALHGSAAARPINNSYNVADNSIRVGFDKSLTTRDGAKTVRGFAVAFETNGPFAEVPGTIKGTNVTFKADRKILSFRYAWANDPSDANLAGTNGHPAAPFRFDNWKVAMAKPGESAPPKPVNRSPARALTGAAFTGGPANTSFENIKAGPFTELKVDGLVLRAAPGHAEINSRFAHTGKQCLRLFGGENTSLEIDLPPLEKPGEIRFQAERWTKRDPFKFRVEANFGASGRWKEIYNGDKLLKVGARFLSDVRIPLNGAIPRKLRFTCSAPKNSGALIDSFQITSAVKMKLISTTAPAPSHPILIGKKHNALLKITINTSGSLEPLKLTQVNVQLRPADGPSLSASDLSVWIDGGVPGQGRLEFTNGLIVNESISFNGSTELSAGENTIWISGEPRSNARLGSSVSATCSHIQINGETWLVTPDKAPIIQRIGVALRQAGQDDVHTYRIPGLATTTKGTLIAVYDNRYTGRGDLPGDIDVGMSRSTDGGQSWEPMRVIMDMGDDPKWNHDGIGDPAILVDDQRGTIWVAATWSHGNRSWNGSGPGLTPEETGQLMLTRSDDDGLTWSKPINITKQVKDPKWRFVLQGPGAGITLRDGTLVFPAQYRSAPDGQHEGKPFSTLIYSKDGGATWKIGTGVEVNTNEAQLVQLGDGSIMINCRDLRGGSRRVAITRDLGQTWIEHPTSRKALPEPVCQASILRIEHKNHGPLIFFANPPQTRGRSNMTIKVSNDEGMTWPEKWHTLVDERSTAYSCLTRVDEDHIGLIYEGPRELYFVRYSIEELMRN
jgi:sialidase-1